MSEKQAEYKAQTALQQKLAAMFAANKDEVSIPKIYIDMTNDIEAAAVLDELLFWTLPKRGTGKTSLRVFRNGALWLAVRRKDWWDRKRLTERQADGAIAKLIKLDLIEKDVFLFDGKPTVHIRINMTVFVKMYGDKMQEIAGQEDDENLIRDLSDLYEMMGLPNEMVISNSPNGEMLNSPNGEIINSPVQPENTASKFSKKQKKGDLLDGLLFYGQKAVENKEGEVEEIIVKLERGLRVNITRSTINQSVARRIIRDGRSVDTWLNWVISEEWRAAHLYIYADLEKVWRDFPQAFDNNSGMNPQGLSI